MGPESFLIDRDTQQSLPADSIVALQQVDNRMYLQRTCSRKLRCHANAVGSQVLSSHCARRLEPGPVHQAIPATDWRIHLLCAMVSRKLRPRRTSC